MTRNIFNLVVVPTTKVASLFLAKNEAISFTGQRCTPTQCSLTLFDNLFPFTQYPVKFLRRSNNNTKTYCVFLLASFVDVDLYLYLHVENAVKVSV